VGCGRFAEQLSRGFPTAGVASAAQRGVFAR
jgi:hypothetical protein